MRYLVPGYNREGVGRESPIAWASGGPHLRVFRWCLSFCGILTWSSQVWFKPGACFMQNIGSEESSYLWHLEISYIKKEEKQIITRVLLLTIRVISCRHFRFSFVMISLKWRLLQVTWFCGLGSQILVTVCWLIEGLNAGSEHSRRCVQHIPRSWVIAFSIGCARVGLEKVTWIAW